MSVAAVRLKMPARPSTTSSASQENDHRSQQGHGDDEEEEDYMSMVIEEPKEKRETFSQKKLRKQREVSLHLIYPSSVALTVPIPLSSQLSTE